MKTRMSTIMCTLFGVMLPFLFGACSQSDEPTPVNPPVSAVYEVLNEGPFAIEVTDLHASYCTLHITPESLSEHSYWYGVTTEELLANFGTMDDVDHLITNYINAVIDNNIETPIEDLVAKGKIEQKVKGLLPDSRMVIFACHVDQAGRITSPVKMVAVKTPPVTPSDNRFTIEVKDITASSAKLSIKTTNDDQYVWLELPQYIYHGMTDDEIKDFLLEHYTPFFSIRNHSGDIEYDFEDALDPDMEYMIIVFGYDGGMTTDLTTHRFKTGVAGDPSLVTFAVEYLEMDSHSVRLKITPSDASISYLAIVADEELLNEFGGPTEEGVTNLLDDYIEHAIALGDCADRAEFAKYYAIRGVRTGSFSLIPGLRHYTCMVAVDAAGEFASQVFLDDFMAPGGQSSDAKVSAKLHDSFDGNQLVAIDSDQYVGYINKRVIPVEFTLEGSAVTALYTLFDVATLEEEQATKGDILDSMLNEELLDVFNFYTKPRVDLLMEWDTDYKLFVLPFDHEENIGELIEIEIPAMSLQEATPIELYRPIGGGELPLGTSVSVYFDQYFDGSELAALDREAYGYYEYWAVLPVKFTLGQTAEKAYYMCLDEYTWEDIRDEEHAISLLTDESNVGSLTALVQNRADLRLEWGLRHRLYLVAVDAEGNPGGLVQIDIDPLLQEEASPIEAYEAW